MTIMLVMAMILRIMTIMMVMVICRYVLLELLAGVYYSLNEGCCHCVDSDNDDHEDGLNDDQTNCRFGVAAQIF